MAGIIANIAKVRPSRIRMRKLNNREMGAVEDVMSGVLNAYGLKLKSVTKEALAPVATHPGAEMGFLQKELRYPLTLLHGLGAAAVSVSGLGLGKNDNNKRMVDRSASGVQGYGLNLILTPFGNRVAIVAAAEGERVKPGEKGGNPARFRDQVFGADELRVNIAKIQDGEFERDVQITYIITDDVDGTGKATETLHSSVTASVYTQSTVKPFPDEYMIKVVSSKKLPSHISTQSSAKEIVEAFAKVHGVPKGKLNFFSLVRERQDKPRNEIVDLGPNFIQDKDGDVMPPIAAALGQYFFENGYPYHGVAANIGGSAEAGLLVPVIWRGGSVLLEFASKKGLKTKDWGDRKKYSEKELATIKEYGFDPEAPFALEEAFGNPFADGIAAFGAITDNYSVAADLSAGRGLLGVEFGIEGVKAHALEISPNGRAEILHAVYDYAQDRAATEALLTPHVTTLLGLKSENEIEMRVAQMLKENELRLKTELGQDYYLALSVEADRFMIDNETYKSLREKGKNQRFTEADDAIIAAVKNQRPEWFLEAD